VRRMWRRGRPPVQSAVPKAGLTALELAHDLLDRIEQGNKYARGKKKRFRRSAAAVRLVALGLGATSTIILGLQRLSLWAGVAFALVALVTVVTVVNSLEPFFAWRSRWVPMEETEYRFYRLRDEVTYLFAATQPDQLEPARIRELFDQYQQIWDQLGDRWSEYRRTHST
jgi:hypothetical protein